MKYLLALCGLFLCLNARAAELRQIPITRHALSIMCTDHVSDALYNVMVVRKHVEIFHKQDLGGGTIRLYQKMETGEWVMLRFTGNYACFIAAGKPEAGS